MAKTTKKAKGKAPLKDMTAMRAKKIKGGQGQAKTSSPCGGSAFYRLH